MGVLAAAFVPSAPALVPELTGGAAVDLARLRSVADRAVVEAVAAGGAETSVVVLGAGPSSRTYDGSVGGSFRAWGVDVRTGGTEGGEDLPLALIIGAWWLDRAGVPLERRTYVSVDSADPSPPPRPGARDTVLLVVGDGSATRTPKAPGAFHPEAETYDAAVVDALGSGDPARLVGLDSGLAQQVMADGVTAWCAAGRALAGRTYDAEVLAADAPYGVEYVVAVWREAPTPTRRPGQRTSSASGVPGATG